LIFYRILPPSAAIHFSVHFKLSSWVKKNQLSIVLNRRTKPTWEAGAIIQNDAPAGRSAARRTEHGVVLSTPPDAVQRARALEGGAFARAALAWFGDEGVRSPQGERGGEHEGEHGTKGVHFMSLNAG
jgi:hypothetical protein